MKSSRSLFAFWSNQSESQERDMCICDRRAASGIAIAILALALLSGCTITIRWEPAPGTEGLPRVARHPIHAGVYYSPQFASQEQSRKTGTQIHTMSIGPASVRLFDDMLSRVFEKTSQLSTLSIDEIAAKQVDVVVVPSLENFDFRLGLDSDSERYSVLYRIALYSNQLVPVASWIVMGKERERSAMSVTGYVENDMTNAATRFLQGFERSAGPALAAIAKQSQGKANPIDAGSVVLNAMRTQMPNLDQKTAAALGDAGVVAIRLVAQSKTDRRLVMRASDTRLKPQSGLALEPATISAVLSVLDQTSHDADIAAVFIGPFAHFVHASQQASQQEAREQQSKTVEQLLFRERTLSKSKEEAGIVAFLLPKGAAADGMSLMAWVIDPASADGLQIEVPIAKR